jgi:hypothetical protein
MPHHLQGSKNHFSYIWAQISHFGPERKDEIAKFLIATRIRDKSAK